MFYDKFVELCKKHYVTPREVAVGVGLHRSAPYAWKNLGTKPSFRTIVRIAKFFDVPVDEIMALVEDEE